MKLALYFNFFILMGFSKKSRAGKYQDGYSTARDTVKEIWKKGYNGDCYNVFDFSNTIKDDLILGDYHQRKGDNWAQEAFKKGARDGATAAMIAIQKDCLDPNYCDDLGTTAAEIIVSDLCKSEYTKRHYQDPT